MSRWLLRGDLLFLFFFSFFPFFLMLEEIIFLGKYLSKTKYIYFQNNFSFFICKNGLISFIKNVKFQHVF